MREIRQSGSEGGGFEFNRFSLPLSPLIPFGDNQDLYHAPHPSMGARRPRHSRTLFALIIGAVLVISPTRGWPQGALLPDSCLKAASASTRIGNLVESLSSHPTAEAFNTVGARGRRIKSLSAPSPPLTLQYVWTLASGMHATTRAWR
jgi:hypothetical protein